MEQDINKQTTKQIPNETASATQAYPLPRSNTFKSCFTIIVLLVMIGLFVIFGKDIFSFFKIVNFYYFIVTVLGTMVGYIIGIIMIFSFIKPPNDLLNLPFSGLIKS